MQSQYLIACKHCDLINTTRTNAPGQSSICPRCGTLLHTGKKNTVDRTLALVVSGIILFVIACTHPLLSLKVVGAATTNTLITGVIDLYRQGLKDSSFLVFMMTMVIPLVKLTLLFYILVSLKIHRAFPFRPFLFRMYHILDEWGMLEVYMLGIVVAMVKLNDFATVSTGTGLYALIALIVISLSTSVTLDAQHIWNMLEKTP